MPESNTPGDCTCVACTAAFGQQLQNIFHTWVGIIPMLNSGEFFQQLVYEIAASTSALQQLQTFVERDGAAHQAGGSDTFKQAGLEEIEALANKCNRIFRAVILLLQKAVDQKESKPEDDEDEKDEERKADDESYLLIGPVPDLTSMKTLGLLNRVRGVALGGEWLENRMQYCQEQLTWVRKSLLLTLQMGRLVQLENDTVERENGAFESELVARGSVQMLRDSQILYVKSQAKKQEKKQRKREKRERSLGWFRGGSAASVSSETDSQVSAQTAVDEDILPVDSTADKPEPPVAVKVDVVPASEVAGQPATETTNIDPVPAPENETGDSNDDSQKLRAQDVTNPGKNVKTGCNVSSSINKMSQALSDTMADWTHRIFGKADEFSKDWESQELEAWVTRCPGTWPSTYAKPMKVPFGHRRLQYGLKKVKASGKGKLKLATFARYIDNGPRIQAMVDDVVQVANRLQRRERICLAFDVFKSVDDDGDQFMMVFFSIRKEKTPVSLTDGIGRKLNLPFEMCKNWEVIKSLIIDSFVNVPDIGPHVIEGHYDLVNARGETILPALWNHSIKPGDNITMVMWPAQSHPLRGYYGRGPPYSCAGLGLEADEARALQIRLERIRAVTGHRPFQPPPFGPPRPPQFGYGMPPRPFPVFGGGGPPRPGPPPPCMRVPPGVRIVDGTGRRRWRRRRSVDENELTAAEMKELLFVDFVQELEKTKNGTLAELLMELTTLKDAQWQAIKGEDWQISGSESESESESGSDSDSGSYFSGSSSSGTRSILDD